MKVFALVVLLVCVCSLEGALVKREAEQVQTQFSDFLSKVNEYLNNAHTYVTSELPQQEKIEELKNHAQRYLQVVREHVDPVTDQFRRALTDVFNSLVDAARTYAPKPEQSS